MILPSARSRELGLSVSVDEAHEGVEVVDGPAAPPAGESTTGPAAAPPAGGSTTGGSTREGVSASWGANQKSDAPSFDPGVGTLSSTSSRAFLEPGEPKSQPESVSVILRMNRKFMEYMRENHKDLIKDKLNQQFGMSVVKS